MGRKLLSLSPLSSAISFREIPVVHFPLSLLRLGRTTPPAISFREIPVVHFPLSLS